VGYHNALQILSTGPELQKKMQDLGITETSTFAQWLKEEKTYLQNLMCEPLKETFEMEYLQHLKSLWDIRLSSCAQAQIDTSTE
jgi:hypothetical protein